MQCASTSREIHRISVGVLAGQAGSRNAFVFQLLVNRSLEFATFLAVAKVDIWKFFDTLAFELIISSLRRRGVPEVMIHFFINEIFITEYVVVIQGGHGRDLLCDLVEAPRRDTWEALASP